ncbi:MAG: hypothetical protein AB1480_12695 [Nitrospirota bacterium]
MKNLSVGANLAWQIAAMEAGTANIQKGGSGYRLAPYGLQAGTKTFYKLFFVTILLNNRL